MNKNRSEWYFIISKFDFNKIFTHECISIMSYRDIEKVENHKTILYLYDFSNKMLINSNAYMASSNQI